MRRLPLVAILPCVLFGCGSGSAPTAAPDAPPPKPPAKKTGKIYVLKDGRQIRAQQAMLADNSYVIKDETGKLITVDKADVAEIQPAQ